MSKSYLLAMTVVVVAVVGAPVAYALSWPALALALVAVPGAVAAAVALDVRRRLAERTRRAEAWQADLDRTLERLATAVARPPARADVPSHEDLLGTVRVIQAQYEGRIDRAQASLDEAVRALHEARQAE